MTVKAKEKTKEMMSRQKEKLMGAETTRSGRMLTPAMDIFETDGAITVLADMPGVKADTLAIDLRKTP